MAMQIVNEEAKPALVLHPLQLLHQFRIGKMVTEKR